MKISLALGPRRTLSPQTAWGCLTTNLALPGAGSLAAGRPIGYLQLALALLGVALTCLTTAHVAWWSFHNWDRLHSADVDGIEAMGEMWQAFRWPVFSLFFFALDWCWGLATGLELVREAKQAQAPPRLS